MRNNPRCFICNQICLGLKGQDIICDTVFVLDDPIDQEMLDSNAFGECHLSCLIGSKWGNYWSSRILNNYISTRNYPVIGEVDRTKILRNERMRNTFLIRDDGWKTSIYDHDFSQRIYVDGGFHVPVKEDIYVNLADDPALVDEIHSTYSIDTTFSLPEFLNKLGIQKRILYPAALETGSLHLQYDKNLPLTMIKTYAEYSEFLPENIVRFVMQNIDTERPPSNVGDI